MSWETKTDYSGLAVANTIIIKSSNENRSGQYLERAGQSGAIVATKPYGILAAPSCEYAIKTAKTYSKGDIKFGAITTIDGKRYALQSIHYENGADQEPVFSATSQQVETTSDGTTRTFDMVAFAVSPDEAAAIIASAFSLSGTGCELIKCAIDGSCSIKNHTVNGDPVASDATMGKAVVTGTILQTGATAPTVAAGTGWEVSSPLTCEDPDADLPVWTFAVEIPLEYTSAS